MNIAERRREEEDENNEERLLLCAALGRGERGGGEGRGRYLVLEVCARSNALNASSRRRKREKKMETRRLLCAALFLALASAQTTPFIQEVRIKGGKQNRKKKEKKNRENKSRNKINLIHA